ncbi:hypothetical protein QZM22_24585 [Burkholderia oklahomensis]|uniref:hypothetical protein n=1 Tax=Burkholderia oklahomensis TaxID=342113 RepID=UPI0026563322|nr:hypothetical protein [Burkholderia oklahomensis]MDN7675596.1 hypothetical protein [Burkholderia oklahomensis]
MAFELAERFERIHATAPLGTAPAANAYSVVGRIAPRAGHVERAVPPRMRARTRASASDARSAGGRIAEDWGWKAWAA